MSLEILCVFGKLVSIFAYELKTLNLYKTVVFFNSTKILFNALMTFGMSITTNLEISPVLDDISF